MKKLISSFFLFSTLISVAQPIVDFEINSGYENMQSSPSGLIEIGNHLLSLKNSYGNNFNQTDLMIFSKSDGALVNSQILSNSYDDYFTLNSAVSVSEQTEYFFTISSFGYDSAINDYSNTLYLYSFDSLQGLLLLNSYENLRSDALYVREGDLISIDKDNLSISEISLVDYTVTQTQPLTFNNDNFTASKIFDLENGFFLLLGNISTASFNSDVFLAKFDLNGQVYWEQVIAGNQNDYISTVKSIGGDIYLGGRSLSYDGIFADQYGEGVGWGDEPLKTNWAMKLDSEGNLLWNKLLRPTWTTQYSGQFTDIKLENNYLFFVGSTYNQYDYNLPYDSVYNQDVFVAKIDIDGNIIWEKSYGGFNNQIFHSAGIYNNQLVFVSNLNRWSFFGVGGNFFGSFGDVTAEVSGKFDNPLINSGGENNNQNDIWVFAINFEGDILWNQFYGGERYDYVVNTIYNDNAVYINSATKSTGYDVGELIGTQDNWLFKLGINTLSIDQPLSDSIKIHPNPSATNIKIEGLNGVEKIELYNHLGQMVLSTSAIFIDVSLLEQGVYTILIYNGHTKTAKKLIKY